MEQTPFSAPEQPERGLAHIGEIMDQLLDVGTQTSQPLEAGTVFEGDELSTASRESRLQALDLHILSLGQLRRELLDEAHAGNIESATELPQVKELYDEAQMDRVELLSHGHIFKPKK